MKVNNKTFKEHKMMVYSFEYQPLSMSADIYQSESSLNIVHGGFSIKPKDMDLVCKFRDKKDISRFIQNITENIPTIIDIGDCYRYECYYQGSSNPSNEFWNGWYKVAFPFLVIQQAKTINRIQLKSLVNDINNSGTYECPYIIEITPRANIDELTIGDYTIHNLQKNKTFVIDGVTKKVYVDNQNRFGDVDFKNNKFPILKTGNNKINLNTITDIDVCIRFREVFI